MAVIDNTDAARVALSSDRELVPFREPIPVLEEITVSGDLGRDITFMCHYRMDDGLTYAALEISWYDVDPPLDYPCGPNAPSPGDAFALFSETKAAHTVAVNIRPAEVALAVQRPLLRAAEESAADCPSATPATAAATQPTTAPPPTTTPSAATPTPGPDFEQCLFQGTVRTGGYLPRGLRGAPQPLVGVHIAVIAPPDIELTVVATDNQGRYSAFVTGEDLPPGFDTGFDPLAVKLRLKEHAHDPGRFEIYAEGKETALLTDPLSLDEHCAEGVIRRDFNLGEIPGEYYAIWPLEAGWKHLAEIYDHIHRATRLADLLHQRLDYGLPLVVCAFCSNVILGGEPLIGNEGAFFSGCNTSGIACDALPMIAFGNYTSLVISEGWPDNREYHEFGHYFMANSFGHAIPHFPGDENHGGYYVNPSTTDSWVEGFAEFFAIMVKKHINGDQAAHLYHAGGAPFDLEFDFRAWVGLGAGEELAIAGLLLDLEDGPADYRAAPPSSRLSVAWSTIVDDRVHGSMLVGELVNNAPVSIDYANQSVAVGVLMASGQEVYSRGALTIPADIPGGGGRGFFAIPIPDDLFFAWHVVVPVEGLPGRETDDDPVDLTLQQVWDTIVRFTSEELWSNGYMFNVADLYTAFSQAFGGTDTNRSGFDDIDEMFIAHGFFADIEGERSYGRHKEVGRTDRAAFREYPAQAPRHSTQELPGTRIRIDAIPSNIAISVHVGLPAPSERASYSYLATPDLDGYITVAVPPPGSGATVTLIALTPAYLPTIAAVIDADTHWGEVEASGGETRTVTVRMEAGNAGPGMRTDRSGMVRGLLLGGALFGLAAIGTTLWTRRGARAGHRGGTWLTLLLPSGLLGVGLVAIAAGVALHVVSERNGDGRDTLAEALSSAFAEAEVPGWRSMAPEPELEAIFADAEPVDNAFSFTPADMIARLEQGQGERGPGLLGIHTVHLTPAIAEAFGVSVSQGIYVAAVVPGTAADRVGLRGAFDTVEEMLEGPCCPPRGDIIIAVDRVIVTPSEGEEQVAPWADRRAGETITLTILRDGRMFDVDVMLGERPPE